MERYEFREGSSNKFWEVAVEGEILIVRFGKVGTAGQTKEKSFAGKEAAEKERAKLIKEKTGKGYVAAGQSARPVMRPVSVAPALAAPPAPATTATPPSPAPAKSPTAALAPSLAGTSTAAAPQRPEHGPRTAAPVKPVPKSTGLLALPTRSRPHPATTADKAWRRFCDRLQVINSKAGRGNFGLDCPDWPVDLVQQTAPEPLSAKDACRWSDRLIIPLGEAFLSRESGPFYRAARDSIELFTAFSHWIVTTRGGAFAMELAEYHRKKMDQQGGNLDYMWGSPLAIGMRSAITAASNANYEAALRYSIEQVDQSASFETEVNFAFILADDRPTAHNLKYDAVLAKAEHNGSDLSERWFLPLIAELPGSNERWCTSTSVVFDWLAIAPVTIAATVLQSARDRGTDPKLTINWIETILGDEAKLLWRAARLEAADDTILPDILPEIDKAPVRRALDAVAKADPEWTFQNCLDVMADGRPNPTLRACVMKLVEDYRADAERTWLARATDRMQSNFRKLTAAQTAVASTGAVPEFLASPPWRRASKRRSDTVLSIAPIKQEVAFTNKVGAVPIEQYRQPTIITDYDHLARWIAEKEDYIDGAPERHRKAAEDYAAAMKKLGGIYSGLANIFGAAPTSPPRHAPIPKPGMAKEALLPWLEQRMDQLPDYTSDLILGVHQQPDDLALLLWTNNASQISNACCYRKPALASYMAAMLSRFGAAATPTALALFEHDPVTLLPLCLDFSVSEMAPPVAQISFTRSARRGGDDARRWLRKHADLAAIRLLPDAVGALGAKRNAAEAAMRYLAADNAEAVTRAVAVYEPEHPQVGAAMAEVLARDPMDRIPKKPAALPQWLATSLLARPILKSGGALPDEAMVALIEMVSFINPDDVYAGVPAMKEACTAESLAAFAWSLFEAWLTAGAPSKDGWAFRTLGWFGDDECARKLTKLVRKWPGETAHARAVTGLDVLADIGSDVALMCLNGIAEKVAFKGLQNKAREKIQSLAEARGLTADELADRLVPDLDLDERGGLDLDFGPRQFRVGFDEFLKPWVKDAAGKRLKDLPKPLKSDDAAKADAASKQWSSLKKDARAIASLQLTRLETMLATGRRSKPATFQMFFATHPLVRHLAQRLVWGVYDTDHPDTAPKATFRVTEDLSFTNGADDSVEIDMSENADGWIGLVHSLHMGDADKTAWGTLFGDYEIAQPFPQLGRETFALTDAEKAAKTLERFNNRQVHSKRLRGMSGGWRTGQPQDGGGIMWVERMVRVGEKTVPAAVHITDGLYAGAASEEPEFQTITGITIGEHYYGSDEYKIGDLDAVTASEVLRAVTLLIEASA